MKVLVVSDAQSVHTQRWTSALKEKGVDVVLYTIKPVTDDFYSSRGIKCHFFDLFDFKREKKGKLYAVKRHFQAVSHLKQVLKEEKPDILHSHFVTSYSLIAALACYRPFIVSVWGSDVYLYPKKSPLNKAIVKFILSCADKILSTSNVMARECRKYTAKPIGITPFGVDTELFKRGGNNNLNCGDTEGSRAEKFVIGSVKTLAENYGTEYLIRAFKRVVDRNPGKELSLELVGKGPDEERLKVIAGELGITDKVHFRGFINQKELPKVYSNFNIACYLSNSESFGVSAIEAMSCKCPVVASDADGFTEVIEDGVTGIIVPKRDPEATADAIQKFIENPQLLCTMGKAGRERVCSHYKWEGNVNTMISIYKSVL
jgi:glycosyltransferase involved in cell wall biosynthesis